MDHNFTLRSTCSSTLVLVLKTAVDHTWYLCNTCGVDHALVYLWADLTNLRPVEILLEFCKAFLICRFNIDFTGMSIYKVIEKKSCQYIDMINTGFLNFNFL